MNQITEIKMNLLRKCINEVVDVNFAKQMIDEAFQVGKDATIEESACDRFIEKIRRQEKEKIVEFLKGKELCTECSAIMNREDNHYCRTCKERVAVPIDTELLIKEILEMK